MTASDRIPLCHQHGPVGDLFDPVPSPEERGDYEVSAAQVAEFHERGFLHPIDLLSPSQVSALVDALERMTEGEYPHAAHLSGTRGVRSPVVHFLGAWLVEVAFHDLIYNPCITIPCAQLLGTEQVRFLHDQVFYKPPRHGGVVAWHQDYSYWTRTEPPGHLTCYIALDDTTVENGCVHMIPGSHRWNLLKQDKLVGDESDMDVIKSQLNDGQLTAFKPEPIVLKAGQCSFHDCLTLHGSYSNRSERPRRGVVLNFMKPDTRSATDKPIMPGAEPVPVGSVIDGEYFPIVTS